jgi:hypothetical protein
MLETSRWNPTSVAPTGDGNEMSAAKPRTGHAAADRADEMSDSGPIALSRDGGSSAAQDESSDGAGPGDERVRDEGARAELQERLAAYLQRGRPRVVITDNVHTMVTIKRTRTRADREGGPQVFTFRLHHMFLDAPPAVLRALGRYADKQEREAARVLRAFIESNDHLVRERDNPRPITVDVEGRHHNLQEIFDDLNAKYFEEGIRARITWGPRTKRKKSRDSIKLGSYTFEDELIRIHPVLDASDVPRFFVEWIVYHEMLHQVHGVRIEGGRRNFHPPEFLAQEAEFEHYELARRWEREHIDALLTY